MLDSMYRSKKNSIVIFSPHMDDAILDMCDHMQTWKNQGYRVKVVTVFSSFRSRIISDDTRRFSGIGSMSTHRYELYRKNEDQKAMRILGVSWTHMDFVDGGFRTYRNRLAYTSYRALFSGILSRSDQELIDNLSDYMYRTSRNSAIFVPLGIGRHADHLIVRISAERVFNTDSIGYYIDFPYALSLRNWSLLQAFFCVRRKRSKLPFSKIKTHVLQCYASQMRLLFKENPSFSEIAFLPNKLL